MMFAYFYDPFGRHCEFIETQPPHAESPPCTAPPRKNRPPKKERISSEKIFIFLFLARKTIGKFFFFYYFCGKVTKNNPKFAI